MSKDKKVSVNQMDKLIKAYLPQPYTRKYEVGEDMIEVVINPTIGFLERGTFEKDVVDMVFDGNTYCPYVQEIAFAYGFLTHFTNVKTDIKADKLMEFCQSTNILEDVYRTIGKDAENIKNETIAMIEFKKELILKAKSDELYDSLILLIGKIGNTIEKLPQSFDLSKFKDFDMSSIKGLIENFTNTGTETQNIKSEEPVKQNIELKDLKK